MLSGVRKAHPVVTRTVEWRVFGVEVPWTNVVVGHSEQLRVAEPLQMAIAERLSISPSKIPLDSIKLVRKSLDARRSRNRLTCDREVCWSHVVDVRLDAADAWPLKAQPGRLVPAAFEREQSAAVRVHRSTVPHCRHVLVIGAGPCGLFAALTLARSGQHVTLCERGKPVEERGRSIGALINRGVVDGDSNFCFGEVRQVQS